MLRKVAALLVMSAALAAQQRVTLAPTSSLTIEGTSNVHAWHATTTALISSIQIAAPGDASSEVEAVTVTIPVTSLKSGKGGLDKNMYKAMHADKHPTVAYRMTSFRSSPENAAYAAVVGGLLTVNGVEKEVVLNATISGDAIALKAVGTTKFRMTEFGIKPVTALMGAIRTGDEVTIRFELTGSAALAVAALPR